eukprot:COSAG03_NODE_5110_length_1338_cov_3.734168_1_plen_40_part_10
MPWKATPEIFRAYPATMSTMRWAAKTDRDRDRDRDRETET